MGRERNNRLVVAAHHPPDRDPARDINVNAYPAQSSTYNFAKQHDVFSSNEKEAVPVFCECFTVIYSLDGIFEDEVS